MQLTLKLRNVPKNCLINHEGRISKYKNDIFYCGVRITWE